MIAICMPRQMHYFRTLTRRSSTGYQRVFIFSTVMIHFWTVQSLVDLMPTILDQTRRRVFKGETLAPEEKVVSIFESHTDITIKSMRDIEYGHKVFLTAGATGLVTHCQLMQGNVADSAFFVDLLEKRLVLLGKKYCPLGQKVRDARKVTGCKARPRRGPEFTFGK